MPTSAASLPRTSWQELAQGRTFHPQQYAGQALLAPPSAAPLLVQAHECHVRRQSFASSQARGETPSPALTEPGEQPPVPGQGQH